MMKKTLTRIGIFLIINLMFLFIGLIIVKIIEPKLERTNWTTEASFSAIQENRNYDFVIMGTSHAREFSRSGNHQLVSKMTKHLFFNLSKGFGHGGLMPNLMAWKHFTLRGNHTKRVIYFVDPWVFFSKKWNEENYCLEDEPFSPSVLKLALSSGLSAGSIINYLKSKFKPSYLFARPISSQPNLKYLQKVDTSLISKQPKANYLDGLKRENFEKYAALFKKFIEDLQSQGISVTLVLPPTLLGIEPGRNQLVNFLETINGVEFYDHSQSISDPHLFYDLHHLNTRGIGEYVKANPELFD